MRQWTQISEVFYPSESGLRPLKPLTEEEKRGFQQLHGVNAFNCAVLMYSWSSLLADCPNTGYVPMRSVMRQLHRFRTDLLGEISRFSQLADELVNSTFHTSHGTSRGFVYGMIDTPVFKEYLHYHRSGNSDSFRYVYSYLTFGKKLHYVDESLESNALRDWLEVEDRISRVRPCQDDLDLIKTAISLCLQNFDHVPFPVHGSGSVAEKGVRTIAEKNSLLESSLPFRVKLAMSLNKEYSKALLTPSGVDAGYVPYAELSARLMFVPKTFKARRSICMEPAVLQWSQQSLRLSLEASIKDGFLGKFVNINDQTWNQRACSFGSLSSLVDTIDLSAASDSVTWNLAKEVFPRKIAVILSATRSRQTVLPDGSVHRNVKFAPMGSAVCFPLQTVLFAAVVISAAFKLKYGNSGRQLTYHTLSKLFDDSYNFGDGKGFQPFRVYGDDIVCDCRLTPTVVSLLASLGFKVNTEKSFIGENAFRESCGIHSLDGKDVTPIYFRFGRETDEELDGSRLSALIALCNRARQYNYYRLGTYLQSLCMRLHINQLHAKKRGVNPILFSSVTDSSAIYTTRPRNTHLRRRNFTPGMDHVGRITEVSNPRIDSLPSPDTRYWYQRDEVSSIRVISSDEDVVGYDNYFYIRWMRSRWRGGSIDVTDASPSLRNSVRTHVGWRWTPV